MKTHSLKSSLSPLGIYAITPAQMLKALHCESSIDTNKCEIMTVQDGIATINVKGLLAYNVPQWAEQEGYGTSYDSIAASVRAADADPSVTQIMMRIDSGGGEVNGCLETARIIARAEKPTYAVVKSLACSAAYALAAATQHIIAMESADVGSIGCIMSWYDDSAMLERVGIKLITLTNAGATLKDVGLGIMSEEQMQFLQSRVDRAAASFQAFVLERRPTLNQEVFNAGFWNGADALSLGLIDEIHNG